MSLFCNALLCVHSSFAIILKRKRNLVALLLLSYRCIVTINVLCLSLYPAMTIAVDLGRKATQQYSVALPHSALGWPEVCDCSVS